MKDVVVSFFFPSSERGVSSESDIGRAEPIKGEKCRTKVSKSRDHISLVRRNIQLAYGDQRYIPC